MPSTDKALAPADALARRARRPCILADARPTALIVDRSVAERLEEIRDALAGVKTILVRERTFELSGLDAIAVESLDAVLESDHGSTVPLPARGSRDDIASTTYTSGSTGTPKGVMHSHESWLAAAEFTRDSLQLSEHDAVVIPVPLHHGLAFRHMLACLLANATIVITADIYQALKAVLERRPTALLLVPAACRRSRSRSEKRAVRCRHGGHRHQGWSEPL